MTSHTDVMVIAAHPDDAEFGAAGTIARWTAAGKQVVYVVCTSGEKGTSDRTIQPAKLATIREQEQKAAAARLGAKKVVFLRYPDQGLEDTPELRKEIVREIRTYRPTTVLSSDPYKRYLWHRDHRVIGQVVMDAVFPFARDHLAYPDLLDQGFEPHKVKEILFWAAEDINYRSDITETFALKLEALKCHESQVSEMGMARVEQWVRERSRASAEDTDFELAEAFHRVELP